MRRSRPARGGASMQIIENKASTTSRRDGTEIACFFGTKHLPRRGFEAFLDLLHRSELKQAVWWELCPTRVEADSKCER